MPTETRTITIKIKTVEAGVVQIWPLPGHFKIRRRIAVVDVESRLTHPDLRGISIVAAVQSQTGAIMTSG